MKNVIPAFVALAITGTSVFAADMPVKYRPFVAPAFSWTGGYVGASVGYGWDRSSDDYSCGDAAAGFILGGCGSLVPLGNGTVPLPASLSGKGGLVGLQGGYNYQFGAAVAGFEVDYSWSRIRGDGISNFLMVPVLFGAAAGSGSNIVSGQKLDSFGTIRGRLGWLPSQQWLIYATGGFAFGHVNQDVSLTGPPGGNVVGVGPGVGFTCIPGQTCFLGNAKQLAFGWTVGAGSEWAISTNVTIKAEYLYANLPGAPLTAVAVAGGAPLPSSFQATYGHIELHVARIGINYLFNTAPVVAKY